MTPESLMAWRERMRWSKSAAARELGLSITGYFQYEAGKPLAGRKWQPRPIPKTVALACAAITHRIPPEE
jgi:hypothetical protein